MKLHLNPLLFADAIKSSASILNIPQEFVEKDYWICQILQRLSRLESAKFAVWKGGTSLAKAHKVVNRFSSDVDIAVLTEKMSQNQQKKFVARISRDTTIDLEEVDMGRDTIKNNRFRKTYHAYRSVITDYNIGLAFLGRFVIMEINTYGNPYPYEAKTVQSFITDALVQQGQHKTIEEYDMGAFSLNVLDKRMTLCEKIVSLIRFSFDESAGLASKIRHFYDLHYLMEDEDCKKYLNYGFEDDLMQLIAHDKAEFDRPPKWKTSDLLSSPLFTDINGTWQSLKHTYVSELGRLSYARIPDEENIAKSTKTLMERVRCIISAKG